MAVVDSTLLTVHQFAIKYRVDVSVVRRWIKEGRIPYTLVGPRKMIQREHVVRQSDPNENRRDWNRRQLVGALTRQGIDLDTARDVVKSMNQEDVDRQLMEATDNGTEQGQRDNPPSTAGAGEGANNGGDIGGHDPGTRQDQNVTRPTTPYTSSARRDRRSVSGPRPPAGRGRR